MLFEEISKSVDIKDNLNDTNNNDTKFCNWAQY